MDPVDRRILCFLQDRPDISVNELAALVGLSHTPCWRRIKQLEAQGHIRGRAVLLDPALMGLDITVYASVRLRSHDQTTLEAFEEAVLAIPDIVDCFSMAGDGDYLLRVVMRSIERYERFLKQTLLHLPGVASINSQFALKRIKNTSKLPI